MTVKITSTFDIPSRYSSTAAYAESRKALLKAEHEAAFDYAAEKSASDTERKANKIVKALLELESDTLYGVHHNGSGHEPAHQFRRSKHLIDSSKILEIAKRAPKGALLHCHFDAMLPPSELVSIATKMANMHIRTDDPLTHAGFYEHALPTFQVLSKEKAGTYANTDIFGPTYIPGDWMLFSKFRASFPGGAAKADEWVTNKIVLDVEDIYHTSQTVNGIWKSFNRSFKALSGLLRYETAWREHFKHVIWDFARDGINYAEIRIGLNYKNFMWSDDGEKQINYHEMMRIIFELQEEELPKIRKEGYTFYGIKCIYATMRKEERHEMVWDMNMAIELKQAFPDLICGFDMAGQEDAGHSLSHWIPELLEMRRKCDELGVDLPFIFHAGETLDHGGDTDSNLIDAILLGTKRIGHGYSMTKHPVLMDLCKEKGIAIETCPISNEVLGLCGTVTNHPLPVLLASNVPCTVNSDDPGVFHSTLSHDFYQIMVGSNKMSLMGWRTLVEWSFQYSMISKEEKVERISMFRKEWEVFCAEIIEKYGKSVNC